MLHNIIKLEIYKENNNLILKHVRVRVRARARVCVCT